MHELSVATSLLNIIRQEMDKHGTTKLLSVKVVCGKLSNVVPEALSFAFEALTKGTTMEGALLELEEIPLTMRCRVCATEFTPELANALFAPCPQCGEEFGQILLTGKELYLENLHAE